MKIRNRVIFSFCLLVCLTIISFGQVGRDRDRNRFPRRGACFYVDADYRGEFFCLQAGEGRREMPPGFNDRISSVRIFGGASVAVFRDHNFRGAKMELRRDVRDLSRARGANDRISSIRVR